MERDCFYNELKYVRDYACKAAGLDPEIAGWKTAVDAMTKQLADAQATVEALQRKNAQLKALVRALPVVESPVKDEDILDNWESDRITFEALRRLLEYRATLDATTPATKGGDGEPAECTNHFTDGSKIFPSRNCCSKGGNGE